MQHKNQELLAKIARFVQQYQLETGASPTYRDIMREFKMKSIAQTHNYIHQLEKDGQIEFTKRGSIKVEAKYEPSNFSVVPLFGRVPCGEPMLVYEEHESVYRLPFDFTGHGETFMLRAEGRSMIDAGIRSGDFVIIRSQNAADPGEIVVALIEDEASGDTNATLKKYVVENGHTILRPMNSTEPDKYRDIPADDCRIAGVLVGYYHKFK
jgi:repressor LexA